MYLSKLEALIERYFCNPERQITLEAGSVVIVQQGYNDRLFFVLQGDLEGYFSEHEEKQVRVFFCLARGIYWCAQFLFWYLDSIVDGDGQKRSHTGLD